MSDLYIGLMSGTSLDGADGVLANFAGGSLQVVASASEPFSDVFRAELLALNSPTHNELHRAAAAANQIAAIYAKVVSKLVHAANIHGIDALQITAIGSHGQTVRHHPQRLSNEPAGAGYTLQLNNPALLAELTGIDVVADFRSRDVAAGGQGAPLVPAFHQSVFGKTDVMVSVLNIGGISNVSILPADGKGAVLGFDCGPGNVLIDAWCQQHTNKPFDEGGSWAASGKLIPALLARLLDEPYFAKQPPKSTGRDLFSLEWLATMLLPFKGELPEDIQNTLTEFTANACAVALKGHAQHGSELIVCGGGAFNKFLLARLQAGLPGSRVSTSNAHGLPALEVEAAAFAWLARQTVRRKPGNLPGVTGARGLRILGAIYFA